MQVVKVAAELCSIFLPGILFSSKCTPLSADIAVIFSLACAD